MTDKEKLDEDLKKMVKALTCPLDCEKCDKNQQECILDIRICLNVILKERNKKLKQKKDISNTMVS